jgi:hypothetical protein
MNHRVKCCVISGSREPVLVCEVEERMEKHIHIVRQGVVTLPYLDDEVPALYTAENKPYIPAFAVCYALGLPVAPHIRKWRNMLLWTTAHKLPLKTNKGTRLVWCLLISEVPFLYGNVIWKYVASERRQQLHEAIEKGIDLANQAYQQMQRDYHTYRQSLLTFLRLCLEMRPQWEQMPPADTDEEDQRAFENLLHEGHVLYDKAALLAKTILQERADNLVIDALIIGEEQTIVDSFSMPLLPVVDQEKKKQFATTLMAIACWHLRMICSFPQAPQ